VGQILERTSGAKAPSCFRIGGTTEVVPFPDTSRSDWLFKPDLQPRRAKGGAVGSSVERRRTLDLIPQKNIGRLNAAFIFSPTTALLASAKSRLIGSLTEHDLPGLSAGIGLDCRRLSLQSRRFPNSQSEA